MADIPQTHRRLSIDPYVLVGPWPERAPLAGGFSVSGGFAGTNSASPGLVAPLSVDPGAGVYSRWVADSAKFVDNGNGTTSWHPSAGTSLTPVWLFNNANLPPVQADYSYTRKRGDTLVTPAVTFQGNQWGNLNGFPNNRNDFALLLVARLVRVHKTSTAGIVESVVSGRDRNANKSDVWLRLDGDYLRSGCLGHHVAQYLHQTGRPVMIGITHYTRTSRQLLFDEKFRLIEYKHPYNYWGYDTNMNLGCTGGPYDADRTVRMDLLDVVAWEGAITAHEMRAAMTTLNAVYGIA